jgi:hypothetical protein
LQTRRSRKSFVMRCFVQRGSDVVITLLNNNTTGRDSSPFGCVCFFILNLNRWIM